MKKQVLLAAVIFTLATPASAQVTEVRLGTNIHDINWTGQGNGEAKERSIAINGEIVFKDPEFLKWAFSPRPYVGGSLNLGGETSYGGGGLLWRQTFGEKFYIDGSFGGVIHTGTREVKASPLVQSVIDGETVQTDLSPGESAQFVSELAEFRGRQASEIDFGTRLLFRQQLALGYRWTDKWAMEVFVEHLSNGRVFTPNRPNEGLDNVGFRASYHF